MWNTANDAGSALGRVVVARRRQIYMRVGICAIAALIFQAITSVSSATLWAAAYIGLQAFEYFIFRRVDGAHPFPLPMRIAFLSLMVLSSVVFAFYGIIEASYTGTAGLVCATLLWSGAILNGAVISGDSRQALACSIGPPLLHFFTTPYFVLEHGGTLGEGLAIVAAGLLNGVCAISIWSAGRKLLATAANAHETSRLALLDPETGLPSRQALQRRAADMQTAQGIVVIAAIGIDRFTHLRGAIGHALMVDLIRELAARFGQASGTPVARLSSGMLGVLLTARDMEHAQDIASDLRCAMAAPVLIGGNRVDVTVTIGLSDPSDADTIPSDSEVSLVDRAMIAVDQARSARRTVGRFDAAHYGNPGSNLSLMSEMLRAFQNGQMSVHYQPKLALRSSAIVGVEALIRWNHPERGAIGPDLFVRMAEETGNIAALTEWVLRRAVDDQRRLRDAGYPLCMSINWSGLIINDVAFTDMALEIAGRAAGEICLEVTETAIIGNPQLARQTLERFRAAGIKISIDDYGAGLSSLAYLKNIPADELKIDKTFVMNMAFDPVDAVLVRSAVSLAHNLGLRSVAEGVENKGTLDLLYAMGCDLAQGYGIARPMPLADLMLHLGRRERKPEYKTG
jgi:EAL domain-containing protein (putative c-di-GMP-specific phosphodiesterase class I)/GGDEF domain-containing protein